MSGQEGRVPPAHLDLDDTRLRYDTYHGSTGLPPGSKSAGEPIQHEQAVQGGLGLRRAESRVIEKSRIQQHDQGLGASRSSRITHMTPKMHQGSVRQVKAPTKKAAFGETCLGSLEQYIIVQTWYRVVQNSATSQQITLVSRLITLVSGWQHDGQTTLWNS